MEGKGNQKQQNKPKQNQAKQQQPNQNKKGGQKGKGPANQNSGSVKQEKAETAVQPGTDSALPGGIVEGLPTQQSSTLDSPVTAQPIKEQVSEPSATPSPKIEVSEPAATPQASPSGKECDAQSKPAKQGKSSGKGGGAGGQKAAGNAQPKNAKASQPSSNPQAAKTASVEQAQKTSDTTSDNEKTKERSPAVSTLSPEQGSKKESSRTPSPNKSAQNQSKKGGKNANAPQPSSNPQAAKAAGVGEAHKISDTTSDNKKTKEQSPAVSTLSPEQGSKKELNRAPSPNKGALNQSKKGGKNANAPQSPSNPQEAKTVAVEEAQKISETTSDNKKTQEQSPAGSTLSPEQGSKKESSRTPSPNKGALNQSKKGGKNTNAPQPSSNPQAAKAAGVEQAQKISDTTSDDKKSQEQSPAVSTLSPEQGSKKGSSRTPSPNKGAQNQSKKVGKNANKGNANADKEAEPQPSGQVESKPESSVKSDKDESEIKINQDSNKTTANSGPASKGGKNASKANKPQNTKDKTDGKVSEQPTSKKPSPSADKPKGTGAAQVPVVSNVTQSDKEDASPTKIAVDPPLVIMPPSQKGETPSATSGPAPLTLDVKLVSPTEDSTPESPQSSGKKKLQKKGQQQPKSNEASPPCQKPSVTVAETTPSNKQAKQSPSSAEQSPPAVKQSSSPDKQSSPLVKPSPPVEQGKPSAKEIPPNVEQTSLSGKQSPATVKKSPPPVETTAKQAQPGVKKGSPVGQSQPSVQTIPVEQAVSNVKSTQPAKQSSPKPSSALVKQSPVVAKSSPPVDQSSSADFEPLLSDLSFSRVTQPILVAAKELEKSPNLEAPDFEPLLTDITVTMGGVACPHVDKIPSGTTAPQNLEAASSKTQPDKEPKKVTPKSDSAPISGSPLKCDAPPFYPSGESPSLPAQLTMPSPEQMSSANKKSSPPKQISPENKPKNNEKSNPKAGGTAKSQPAKKEDAPLTTKIDDIANMTSPSAVVEVSNRLNAVEKENAELRIRIGDLTALLSKLEVRVNVLEKAAGTSSTVALQTSANNTHAASQAVINNANVGSQATAAVKTAGSQSKPTPKKDDDDDGVDLFASDSEEEDAEASKIREQRLAEYAAKKSKKPALIAKSSIILDVKPWDDETDMKAMEEQVRKIAADGLLWGASKLVPLAYGIHKLQINCVVEDDKISIDWLQETIEEIEDYVQSVDIAAFNKI